MPYAQSKGARLYYEEAGRGTAIVFVHEFSGDFRSWEAQMRFFSRRYRSIAFNARGYPPSEVPPSPSQYSHTIAADDIRAVMRHLGISKAHIIGCSMGAYATIMFGLRYPRNALSLTTVGAGAGGILDPGQRAQFLKNTEANARRYEEEGLAAAARLIRKAPNRIQLENKDPRGFREFFQRFAEHSALGHANTLRGVQLRRPPLYTMEKQFARLKVPFHALVGDEDESALTPSLFIKRACPAARLTVVPATGHLVNVEEPALFNSLTDDFLALVDSGRWRPRDPRSLNKSTMAKGR
ncbi:MAG TPA: alpha/beta hydrolase [Burkholderiales bacterium]|nr:alpha/beta hydrolase [Burkholderiales bacterium]